MKTDSHIYNRLDPAIEARVEDLLQQMTLAEKVGQTVLANPFAPVDWEQVLQEKKIAEQNGLAFEFTPQVNPETVEQARAGKVGAVICDVARINNQLQRAAVAESRLHIPLLVGADVLHGYRTIFPIPLAESCTWNPGLAERASAAAASEAAAVGINWIYAPMVDIARDPRWGRIAEGAGEDPYLGGAMARARVRGFQSSQLPGGWQITACPKHFAAYGAAEGGRDYNTVDVSERSLRDIYLPPFHAGFDAGAGSTMSAFNEIGGVPCTSNPYLLRTILRDDWGWRGVVVSDYNSIGELVQHGVARDLREAARVSMLTGVDIDLASGAYACHLEGLVEDGEVPVAILDEAVRRVLLLKVQMGLFERPYVDENPDQPVFLRDETRELALEVARQSMVLLKNEQELLPLSRGVRVALVGPLANNTVDPLGAWSSAGQPAEVETLLDGLRHYLPEEALIYTPGCAMEGEEGFNLPAAIAAAQAADVIILAVGESREMSGEAHSRVHLGLPGKQQELADILAATGKPLVAVLYCGRPLVVPKLAAQTDALLVAWHGGTRAGRAAADLLFGAANPSGKLTASWPRAEGQIPVYYGHKATGRPAEGKGTTQFHEPYRSTYLDEPNSSLFPFGAGLSYTRFAYRRLEVLTPEVPKDGTLKVRVAIQNTGGVAGDEIVQLYVRDLVASVTRPVKELKGFARLHLEPGEEGEVLFEIPVTELGFHDQDMQYTVEPGKFQLWIGPDSNQGLEGEFEVC